MIYKDLFARQIAEYLLEIQAVKLSPEKPYTWTSGWKAPIYCDNRLILSYPDIRNYIFAKLKEALLFHFSDSQSVAGVATAGIPASSVIAHDLHMPQAYVRGKAKGHGRENRIEGKLEQGTKCVVIEDLISTGGSSLDAVKALKEGGVLINGVLALFSYDFDAAHKAFEDESYPLVTLCDYHKLLEVALEKNYVAQHQMATLKEWRNAPDKWGQ